MWKDVAESIRGHENFVITTHVNPEGDAIGSEVALAAFLEDLGKKPTVVNSSPTPQNSLFMDAAGSIKVYPRDFDAQILEKAEVVLILDVNNWGHLGLFADVVRESPTPRICIDHHQGGDGDIADIVVKDTSAAATGVMIYDLIRFMDGEITPRIAEAVYASIITDTGTFRFSNTDERVFRIATELTQLGVDPFTIHRHVFSKTPAAVKLLGAVLNTLDSTPDGKLAWIHASREMFDKVGADYEDSDGLLDIVRATRGVEFCFFFKELPSGKIKVSLRSNGKVDVYEIAKSYGGGGHRMASGLSINGPMKTAIESLVKDCAQKYIPKD
jgi:phosphoesterase RecJ-like protein